MSLRHIMLGMLREPHSGYDIKKEYEDSQRNFWGAELSQIYPLLQKLDDDGLVTSKAGASDIGPTRRVYKRTAKGKKELVSSLQDGPIVGTEKIAYLAQVYYLADLNGASDAIAFMQELRDYMVEWLRTLENTQNQWRSNDPRYPDSLPDNEFFAQLTLDMGLRKVRTNVEWCEHSIARIRARNRRKSVRST